jgi:hypothetical protein
MSAPLPPLFRAALVSTPDSTPMPSFLPSHGSHKVQENRGGRFIPNRDSLGNLPQIHNELLRKSSTQLGFGFKALYLTHPNSWTYKRTFPSPPRQLFPIARVQLELHCCRSSTPLPKPRPDLVEHRVNTMMPLEHLQA